MTPATEAQEFIENESILQASVDGFDSGIDTEGGDGDAALFHLDEESILFNGFKF